MKVAIAVQFLLVLAISVTAVWVHTRSARVDREAEWVRYQYEARVVGPGFELIKRYVRRTRAWRVAGAGVGAGLSVVTAASGRQLNFYVALFVGWFIAGVLGELAAKHQRTDRRGASLTPRNIQQFLPRFAKRVLLVSVVSTLATSGLAAVVSLLPRAQRSGGEQLEVSRPIVGLALTVALAIVSLMALRRLTYKPFPVSEPEIDVAEAAIRTAASVRIVAGWSVLQFIVTTWIGFAAALRTQPPLSTLLSVIGVLGLAGIMVAWTYVPTRVLRRRPQEVTPA